MINASLNGIKVILNPAPARELPDSILKQTFLITPNETEAEILTGKPIHDPESADEAATCLLKKGVKNVIITMGASGAYVKTDAFSGMIPGIHVKAIDTTAAGDVFNGALAVSLSESNGIVAAVNFANKAASISVTRMGAQSSAPFRKEID